LLGTLPVKPKEAEFGITIDFVRGESDPVKVFSNLAEMLDAFSEIDKTLIGSVSPDTETATVIEGIEAASITTWIKNKIKKIDDEALKDFEIKKQIGAYAVKAKYRIIEFLDEKEAKENEARREQLKNDLIAIAPELPSNDLFPPTIDLEALSDPMNKIQRAKSNFSKDEKIIIKSDMHSDYQIDTTAHQPVFTSNENEEYLKENSGETEMTLLIRKADLIGNAQWEFKYKNTTLHANIDDHVWLDKFHRGEERLIPGTYMRAIVRFRYRHDHNGELLRSEYDIAQVLATIPPTPNVQERLFHRHNDL
jgi:hypothetical protein